MRLWWAFKEQIHFKNLYNRVIFIGRTDAEAEVLILWPPDVKN